MLDKKVYKDKVTVITAKNMNEIQDHLIDLERHISEVEDVPLPGESSEGSVLQVENGEPVWKEPAAKTIFIKENTKGEVHIWDYDSGIYNFVNEQMYYNFVAIMKINGDGDGVVALSTLYSGDAIQISIIRTVTKKKVMWIGTVLENGDMFRITHDTVNNVWETTKESLGTSFLRVPTVPGTEGQVLTAGASGLPQWSDPPESGVQPDMDQNDSTAPDYVKNRTHYSAHFEKVYPDEDILDRHLYNIYASYVHYYVGSEVLSSDEIMGAEVYGRTGMSKYTTATIDSSSPVTDFDLNGEHSTLYFNSEHRAGTEILVVHEEFEYDGKTVKTGIYFREAYQTYLVEPIRLSVSHDSIKKLDEKFIPDTIARKTDIGGSPYAGKMVIDLEYHDDFKYYDILGTYDRNEVAEHIMRGNIMFRVDSQLRQMDAQYSVAYGCGGVMSGFSLEFPCIYVGANEDGSIFSNVYYDSAGTLIVGTDFEKFEELYAFIKGSPYTS